MLKSKRFNASMIAVVVLSVILAVAVTVGATLAWFSAKDDSTGTFNFRDTFAISIAGGGTASSIIVDGEDVLPGSTISVNFTVTVDKIEDSVAETVKGAYIRAQFTITGEDDDTNAVLDLSTETVARWKLVDGWWYYVGLGEGATEPAEVLLDGTAIFDKAIVLTGANFDNEFANSEATIKVDVQAVQSDYVTDVFEAFEDAFKL